MADGPSIYSIAAHRGFADALVAGLLPRYSEPELGLARLTLLLPSGRAMRTMSEAFIRLSGSQAATGGGAGGAGGMLMPRMVVAGDLELDESLGPLLDPLGGSDIPPAVEPTRRWLRLASLLAEEMGADAPRGSALLRLAQDVAGTMDRLLVEDIGPEELVQDRVLDLLGDLSHHWQNSLRLFARVQARWLAELQQRGELDAAARRNRLFDHAACQWRSQPPSTPIIAAGITSASPALARLLRVVSDLPDGAVILPDLDLAMEQAVWEELGTAGALRQPGDAPFQRSDAVTHPQYHLKLLLNRMGIARAEVRQWHRKGVGAAPPTRSRAISSLFLPPDASRIWIDLPSEDRRLSGVRIMETANPEEEAQSVALLVRQAIAEPERRVAVVTPDRGLARRIVHHLRRWNITADDSAGRPLSQTAAGRLFLLLAETAAEQAAPIPLLALLEHPLVHAGMPRGTWLAHARAFEMKMRGPRHAPGLEPLRAVAQEAQVLEWWAAITEILAPLMIDAGATPLADLVDRLAAAAEAFAGEAIWAGEDGRALASFVEDLRLHSADVGTVLELRELPSVLSDAMEQIAVRPPYGGHSRVAIYGLLESRMSRADLVICAGLNEGTWPAAAKTHALLAPGVLRAIGVPGADFRIGLSAHDLAGALGAPEVVLSRSARDLGGPAIPSRFLLRVQALLGRDLLPRHRENAMPELARAIDDAPPAPHYLRPSPRPSAEQRKRRISVTALDRLRSDPYQFYAGSILGLKELDGLDAEPSAAWRGTAAHEILEDWHRSGEPMSTVAARVLQQMHAHPLMRALWEPRLMKALEWVEQEIAAMDGRQPVLFEAWGAMMVKGVEIFGKVDRIDRMDDGALGIVDYKTGGPPSGREVEAGYALQLGTIGLMAERGAFAPENGAALTGEARKFEYWSLAKSHRSETGFGYIATPLKEGAKRSGIAPGEFLPQAEDFLHDALDRWILGEEGFTARLNPDAPSYATYDQLMRLDEWMGREE